MRSFVLGPADPVLNLIVPYSPEENWRTMTNSLAGLFCSSLGQIDASITASPEDIFPDSNTEGDRQSVPCERLHSSTLFSHAGISFRHAQLPAENLCTENLTPFLKLLPCKGLSGLSALMKPYVLLAHEWHAMGVDYLDHAGQTHLGLKWEAVVDLTKGKAEDAKNLGKRPNLCVINMPWLTHFDADFSISSIFDRLLPPACPAAGSSRIVVSSHPGTKVIILDDAGAMHPDGGLNWKLDRFLAGKDIKLRVLNNAGKLGHVSKCHPCLAHPNVNSPYSQGCDLGVSYPSRFNAFQLRVLHQTPK